MAKRQRKAKQATPGYLEGVALWYLERYPGSVARVRQALHKRVRRSVQELDTDPAAGAAAVDEVIAKLLRMGLLDDARFAKARIGGLRARGLSRRAIEATLRRQGIAPGLIEEAVAEHAEAGADELQAARAYVRRRRLGPFRSAEKRAELRDKDLARLARGGFAFTVARDALEEELSDAERFNPWG